MPELATGFEASPPLATPDVDVDEDGRVVYTDAQADAEADRYRCLVEDEQPTGVVLADPEVEKHGESLIALCSEDERKREARRVAKFQLWAHELARDCRMPVDEWRLNELRARALVVRRPRDLPRLFTRRVARNRERRPRRVRVRSTASASRDGPDPEPDLEHDLTRRPRSRPVVVLEDAA